MSEGGENKQNEHLTEEALRLLYTLEVHDSDVVVGVVVLLVVLVVVVVRAFPQFPRITGSPDLWTV